MKVKQKVKVKPSIRQYAIRSTRDLATLVENAARIDGWSTGRLAGVADLSWITVHNLIHGVTRFPRLQTAIQLLAALDYEITVRGVGPRRQITVRDVA